MWINSVLKISLNTVFLNHLTTFYSPLVCLLSIIFEENRVIFVITSHLVYLLEWRLYAFSNVKLIRKLLLDQILPHCGTDQTCLANCESSFYFLAGYLSEKQYSL